MLQFDHRNGGQHDLGFSMLAFEDSQEFTYRFGLTLGGDQHPGVED